MQRQVGNRLAPRFRPSQVVHLVHRGRYSGRWQAAPVVVLDHDGHRYLVSVRGESDWVRNLRAGRHGRLATRRHVEEIAVVEVPVQEREPLINSYLARFGTMPTVAACFRALPDPADHPIFRIVETDEPTGTGAVP
jgi:deazaflavin-dependent oxidoreductase (nitroreductase family)